MDAETRLKIEERIIAMLKTVYDPEIPVNIYDLGLIYKIDLQDDGDVSIDMTLTAPKLSRCRFYYGRCASKGGFGRRGKFFCY